MEGSLERIEGVNGTVRCIFNYPQGDWSFENRVINSLLFSLFCGLPKKKPLTTGISYFFSPLSVGRSLVL